MIHTVKIDDETQNEKKIMNDLRHYCSRVEFEKSAKTETIPEGYITSEEFRKKAMDKVKKFCDENGIILV